MKKIVIPAILTATVLIAGMFAFMPIEKASTVHTTVLAQAAKATTVVDLSGVTIGATSYVMLYDGAGTGRTASLEVNLATLALPAGLVLERIAPGTGVWSPVAIAAFPISAGSAAVAQGHADTVALALRISNPTGGGIAFGAAPAGSITVSVVGSS